jgi:hypothetical protein
MKRLCLMLVLVVKASLAQGATAPAEVSVVANEYAFLGFPATIAPGPTLFSFENRGEVRHEMTIILLKPGVTMKDALAAGPAVTGQKVAESLIGLLVARKHEAAGGKLFVELKSGERYLVICNLKDTPDGQQHSALGMVASFDVP